MRLCLRTGCFLKRRSRLNEVAGWTLIQSDWCPYRKRLAHRHTEGRAGEDPEREDEAEEIFEQMMDEDFPKLKKDSNVEI